MSIDLENSKRKAAKASKFPEDVVLGMPNVEILGHSEMRIENYRGLIEYTDQLVRVQTKIGQIRITGNHLQVDSYTNDDMKITGKIAFKNISIYSRICKNPDYRSSYGTFY